MNIVLAGGSGFVGKALVIKLVEEGYKIILLTRNPEKLKWLNKNFVTAVAWDGKCVDEWAKYVDSADAVINLSGESIAAKRWSQPQKKKILESRINATRAIVDAIRSAGKKPPVFMNASAVGYYGNVENGDVIESNTKGSGFLADVCEAWENEARAAESLGVRVVMFRLGVVLGEGGGALAKMIPSFKLFIGGPLGSGMQWFPWVHRDDVSRAICFALKNQKLSGPINMTAPEAVTMKQFCAVLGKSLNRPSWAPVPAFILKVLLGEMSEMFLTGQKAIPRKLVESGYQFSHPQLDEALHQIIK
ncbi:MAG: TIGR01777 family protein [Candidatus Omnitrophica bacterium]|nr:TIGR01777 family protein [Candidatus Omnitrophota bacterium]